MTFTAAQLVTCAEREAEQRRWIYPRWVENRRMTQAFADEQLAMMEQIARDHRAMADAESAKSDLFGGAA